MPVNLEAYASIYAAICELTGSEDNFRLCVRRASATMRTPNGVLNTAAEARADRSDPSH